MKMYELALPYIKVGDTMNHLMEENKHDSAKALIAFAEMYEDAALICRRAAGLAVEGDLTIDSDSNGHIVPITGNDARLDVLSNEGMLYSFENEEDEEYLEEEEDLTEDEYNQKYYDEARENDEDIEC